MDILYDHQIFCMQKYGGISRYFYEIVSRIAQKENAYFYEGYHINEYGLEDVADVNVISSMKRPKIPKTGRIFEMLNGWQLRKHIKRGKFDIYHPTYYRDYGKGKCCLVLTVHDMIHELFPKYFTNSKRDIEEKENLIKKADRIIAISKSTKHDLIDIYGIPEEKINIVYHGNSLRIPVTTKRIEVKPYILYVGNRGGYKNFIPFIKAFANSLFRDEIKLIAFGGGKFSSEEEQEIHRLGLEYNIEQISGPDIVLANLYKYAEAFAYPSEYEGFGFPPLEAMYYETPVLCSNTSSLPEVVGKAGLYFSPSSIDEMMEAINKIISDVELRKRLVIAGKIRERLFDWNRCAEETLNVYQKALGEGRN